MRRAWSGRGRFRSQGAWGVLSQAANSAGNLALSLMVARSASVEAFGAWSLGYAVCVLTLGAVRAMVGTPLLMASRSPEDHRSTTAGGVLGLSLLFSAPAAALVLCMALVVPYGSDGLVALAAVLPLMLVQDGLRYLYFSNERPRAAAACDLAWLLLQFLGFVTLVALGQQNAASLSLLWGLTAALSAAPGLVRMRGSLPTARAVRTYSLQHRRAMSTLGIDYLVVACSVQAAPYVLALVVGLEGTGGLRGAQILLGPVNVLVMGLTPIFTVDATRRAKLGQPLDSLVYRWTALVGAVSLIYGALLLLLPTQVGNELLGDTWPVASPLIGAFVVQAVISGPVTGVQVALRGLDRLRDGLSLRLRTSVPMLGIPVAGIFVAEERGAAWGFAIGTMVAIAQSVRELRRGGTNRLPARSP